MYKFDGLSGIADDSLPVVVTVKNNTIDRKRLNIAHELGHLVLNMRGSDTEQTALIEASRADVIIKRNPQ